MKNWNIYLSGPIHDQSKQQSFDWREDYESLFSTLLNKPHIWNPLKTTKKLTKHSIVQFDKFMINNSDIVIAYLTPIFQNESHGVGTLMEIMYAFEHKKLVVGILDNYKNMFISPWLSEHCTHLCENFHEAYLIVKGYMLPEYDPTIRNKFLKEKSEI